MNVYNLGRDKNIPRDAVYVGRPRAGMPSIWGNPYSHKSGTSAKYRVATREEAVRKYEEYLRNDRVLMAMVHTLAGKDLVCWCAPEECHAEVLLRVSCEAQEAMKEKEPYYIAFTGHRPNKIGGYDINSPMRQAVIREIDKALKRAMNKFSDRRIIGIVGGALGVDTDAARQCLRLGLEYHLYIPFPNQTGQGTRHAWPAPAQAAYRRMRELAAKEIMVSEGAYHPSKMQKRNEAMVDNCDALVAVWDGTSGGTANCVDYAKKVGKPIVRINPKDLWV